MSDALIGAIVRAAGRWSNGDHPPRVRAVRQTLEAANRFTEEAIGFAVNQQMAEISEEALVAWRAGRYALSPRRIGVLNAGNIPFVGLQDFLAVILTGHRYIGTCSSRSPHLLPAFVREVVNEGALLEATFLKTEDMWKTAEAILATGTDATCSWAKERAALHRVKDLLLRSHRYGVAILDGHETTEDLDGLAEDVLLHEGAGCRSVAVIWAPKGLAPDRCLERFAAFRAVFPPHADTPGALAMQQAFLAAVNVPHAYGEGLEFLVSRGDAEPQGPCHVRWIEWEALSDVTSYLAARQGRIQVVAARAGLRLVLPESLDVVALGDTQRPRLSWRPDNVDTIGFLASL